MDNTGHYAISGPSSTDSKHLDIRGNESINQSAKTAMKNNTMKMSLHKLTKAPRKTDK